MKTILLLLSCAVAMGGPLTLPNYKPRMKRGVMHESKAVALERNEALVKLSSTLTIKLRDWITWGWPEGERSLMSFNVYYKTNMTDPIWKPYATVSSNFVHTPYSRDSQFFSIRTKDRDLPQESK
jgi:hypothetical protein